MVTSAKREDWKKHGLPACQIWVVPQLSRCKWRILKHFDSSEVPAVVLLSRDTAGASFEHRASVTVGLAGSHDLVPAPGGGTAQVWTGVGWAQVTAAGRHHRIESVRFVMLCDTIVQEHSKN